MHRNGLRVFNPSRYWVFNPSRYCRRRPGRSLAGRSGLSDQPRANRRRLPVPRRQYPGRKRARLYNRAATIFASDLILAPTRRIVGVEDPSLQALDAPNYFEDAWNAYKLLQDALQKPVARDEIVLAVNSRQARTLRPRE